MRCRSVLASLPILITALGTGCEHPTEPTPATVAFFPAAALAPDAGTSQLDQRFVGRESGLKLALSLDGALLASTWAGADLWEMANHNLVRPLGAANHGLAVAFSPDGRFLAFTVEGKGVQVWAVPPE